MIYLYFAKVMGKRFTPLPLQPIITVAKFLVKTT